MQDVYDAKFIEALSMLVERSSRIATVEDADRCMEMYKLIDKARTKGKTYLLLEVFEGIARRMQQMVQEAENSGRISGVYVIAFSDGHIKIGRSSQFDTRLRMISDQSVSAIDDHEFFPCSKSSYIEATAHRFFAENRIKNEFFKSDFDDACDVVRSLISSSDDVKH